LFQLFVRNEEYQGAIPDHRDANNNDVADLVRNLRP